MHLHIRLTTAKLVCSCLKRCSTSLFGKLKLRQQMSSYEENTSGENLTYELLLFNTYLLRRWVSKSQAKKRGTFSQAGGYLTQNWRLFSTQCANTLPTPLWHSTGWLGFGKRGLSQRGWSLVWVLIPGRFLLSGWLLKNWLLEASGAWKLIQSQDAEPGGGVDH